MAASEQESEHFKRLKRAGRVAHRDEGVDQRLQRDGRGAAARPALSASAVRCHAAARGCAATGALRPSILRLRVVDEKRS